MTVDHFAVYWIICIALELFDFFLYQTGAWNNVKLHIRNIPDNKWNILKVVLINQVFVSIPLIYLFAPQYSNEIDWRYVPLQIPLTIFIFELLFYYLHRLLHTTWLYPSIHKIHHKWVYPCSISTFYAHPVEHALTNVIPVALSAYLTGLPFTLVRIWHILALINGLFISHGGYDIGQDFHDNHHLYVTCNYGAFKFLDWFHGTYHVSIEN